MKKTILCISLLAFACIPQAYGEARIHLTDAAVVSTVETAEGLEVELESRGAVVLLLCLDGTGALRRACGVLEPGDIVHAQADISAVDADDQRPVVRLLAFFPALPEQPDENPAVDQDPPADSR